MPTDDIDALLAKSILADPSFATRKYAPCEAEERKRKKEQRRERASHLEGWYNMRRVNPRRDAGLKKDLELLQYRNFVVDERAYRRPDKDALPKFAELGTVVRDDLIDTRNLPRWKEGKSLFDEWMKEDGLRSVSNKLSSKDIIDVGSSALSQQAAPRNLSAVIPAKYPKDAPKKKKKVSKRKLRADDE